MSIAQSLKARRSIYSLNKMLPMSETEVTACIQEVVELVPDAFNMKSQRVVIALGGKHDQLWDAIYGAFGGKVQREKIDSFKAGAGTVLYFIDTQVVGAFQAQFPRYAENFPTWAQQSNGMLQLSVWIALRDLGIGANLQHYNPVIDDAVKKLFGLPDAYQLVAQMPFGGIAAEAEPKEREDVSKRVRIYR